MTYIAALLRNLRTHDFGIHFAIRPVDCIHPNVLAYGVGKGGFGVAECVHESCSVPQSRVALHAVGNKFELVGSGDELVGVTILRVPAHDPHAGVLAHLFFARANGF